MGFLIGINPTDTYTTEQLENSGVSFGLGDAGETHEGNKYVWVKAGTGGVGANDAVAIDEAYTALKLEDDYANAGHKVGVAPVAIAASSYGWVQVRGVCSLNVAGAYAADASLYTTSTAGTLDDAVTTTESRIYGLVGTASATTGATTVAAFMAIEPFAQAENTGGA